MRYDLNTASKEIARTLNMVVGVRRTYGGSDDARRMQIFWQLVRYSQVAGTITLVCEDGAGPDGLRWHSNVQITAPGVFYEKMLITPWERLQGRRAKRISRQRFFTSVETIVLELSKLMSKTALAQSK